MSYKTKDEKKTNENNNGFISEIFLNRKQGITKTCLYNSDPIAPHFYTGNWGLLEYTLFFLFLFKNIDCRYTLEPPRRGGSNEYPQSLF